MKKLFILLAALSVTACAYTPQTANLTATADIQASNIGEGKEVAIKVVDERSSRTLGHRGGAIKGAKITTDQEITSLFSEAFHSALNKLGFKTTLYTSTHPNKLRIDIRDLNYYTSMGFWTGGVHTQAAAKITAGNPEDAFEKVYTSENEKRVVFVPGANKNERLLNETISSLITKIVTDENLIEELKKSTEE